MHILHAHVDINSLQIYVHFTVQNVYITKSIILVPAPCLMRDVGMIQINIFVKYQSFIYDGCSTVRVENFHMNKINEIPTAKPLGSLQSIPMGFTKHPQGFYEALHSKEYILESRLHCFESMKVLIFLSKFLCQKCQIDHMIQVKTYPLYRGLMNTLEALQSSLLIDAS